MSEPYRSVGRYLRTIKTGHGWLIFCEKAVFKIARTRMNRRRQWWKSNV